MNKSEVVKFFGSQAATAAALGIKQPSVAVWTKKIPALRQIQIERITGGKLRADPRCFEPLPIKAA